MLESVGPYHRTRCMPPQFLQSASDPGLAVINANADAWWASKDASTAQTHSDRLGSLGMVLGRDTSTSTGDPTFTAGTPNQYVSDGVDDLLLVSTLTGITPSIDSGSGQFTIVGSLLYDKTGMGSGDRLFAYQASGGYLSIYIISGNVRLLMNNSGGLDNLIAFSESLLADDDHLTYAFVIDGSDVHLHYVINGGSVATFSGTRKSGTYGTWNDLIIGANNVTGGNSAPGGYTDTIVFTDYALSAADTKLIDTTLRTVAY